MERTRLSPWVLIGLFLSVAAGVLYYLFAEVSVQEDILTYRVSNDQYSLYKELIAHKSSDETYAVSLSPNYESISDTMMHLGVRHFELREFYTGIPDLSAIEKQYFEKANNIRHPELVKRLDYAKIKPIGKSIGLALILLLTVIVFDRIQAVRRKRNSSSK